MKRIPFIAPTVLLVIVAAFWLARQASEASALRAELQSLRAMNDSRSATADAPAALEQVPHQLLDWGAQAAELRAELEREQKEIDATRKALSEVRKQIPPVAEGETVVSLGRISDMGHEVAQAIRGALSPFDVKQGGLKKEDVQASLMKLMAWMPEISGFEERPAEIASFQAAILRDLFDLDASRTRQVEAIIAAHFAALGAQRLTAANSAQPHWRERRADALAPLLWQLRPFIPANYPAPATLSRVVNMGAGFETKSETHFSTEPGKSTHTVTAALPAWPDLPWLPTRTHHAK
jgi:hypothetical protein